MTGTSRVSIYLVENFEKEKRQWMLRWLPSCGVPGDCLVQGMWVSKELPWATTPRQDLVLYVHTCVCVLKLHVCVHAGAHIRSPEVNVRRLPHSPPYILRQHLFSNPELTNSTKLVAERAPGIFLSLPRQNWDFRCLLPCPICSTF